MKNPFKRTGFDSIIAKDTRLNGDMILGSNSTTVVDGSVMGNSIGCVDEATQETTLVVGGNVVITTIISVPNVTITGTVVCGELHVEGTLAIKRGAKVDADLVKYRRLVIEPGAVLNAKLSSMDEQKTTS